MSTQYDPPDFMGSRMATDLSLSPFRPDLNGSDCVKPPLIEYWGVFAHQKLIAGENPFTVYYNLNQTDTPWPYNAIESYALYLTMYSSRSDSVSFTGYRYDSMGVIHYSVEYGCSYSGSYEIGAHNVPTQSGYYDYVTAVTIADNEGNILGVDVKFDPLEESPYDKGSFQSIHMSVPWQLTDISGNGTSLSASGDGGSIALSLSDPINVGQIFGDVFDSFVDTQFWWGDLTGLWKYNDFTEISGHQFSAQGVDLREIGAFDGTLKWNELAYTDPMYQGNPYLSQVGLDEYGSPRGTTLIKVSAFTGWAVDAEGANRVYLTCSRTLVHHNSDTPLTYWTGYLVCSAAGLLEIHVVSTGNTVPRGKVMGMNCDVDIPMPAAPSVPLANDGTYPITGRYNFVVLASTPAEWAAYYGVTLIYD